MKWYDYLACLWFADIISASLVSFNVLWLTIGVVSYTLYEGMRKGVDNGNSKR